MKSFEFDFLREYDPVFFSDGFNDWEDVSLAEAIACRLVDWGFGVDPESYLELMHIKLRLGIDVFGKVLEILFCDEVNDDQE